ncbi:oxidoreductase [Undibacterium sp.]|jgi:NAD(P)-dependent dehydrogenase (short-subunit alcohol dehydrogenase family)|uniref:oxidoreductase n=1 Tax=Undibacterium sp. TaxID=1914977 RepID=UPI002BE0E1FA|nr:oxidoreductase [Undibacterium sp.]HTD03952.1 oxidoreductase [Undibacterium sp.]
MNSKQSKIFLITGVSSGMGRAFSEAALAAGHIVVGTVRDESAGVDFEAINPGRAKSIVLDVTNFYDAAPMIAKIIKEMGAIDVLVNNAGYGHEGTLEESPLVEMQRQFDVNVFGAVAMIKAVLPGMRERRTGHIINITSMAGLVTFPGISYYSGSKFALEGVSEVLSKEVKDFGIKVTAFELGSFRTDWAGRSMVRTNRSISDYDGLFDPIRRARAAKNGKQLGDPTKAAQALLRVVGEENPPVHLILGSDAIKLVREKISSLSEEIDAWEELSRSTDFD